MKYFDDIGGNGGAGSPTGSNGGQGGKGGNGGCARGSTAGVAGTGGLGGNGGVATGNTYIGLTLSLTELILSSVLIIANKMKFFLSFFNLVQKVSV